MAEKVIVGFLAVALFILLGIGATKDMIAAIAITSISGLALLSIGAWLGYRTGERKRDSYYERLRNSATDSLDERRKRADYAEEILATHRSISQEIADEPNLRFSEMAFALETQLNLMQGRVDKANYEKVLRSLLTQPFKATKPTGGTCATEDCGTHQASGA